MDSDYTRRLAFEVKKPDEDDSNVGFVLFCLKDVLTACSTRPRNSFPRRLSINALYGMRMRMCARYCSVIWVR